MMTPLEESASAKHGTFANLDLEFVQRGRVDVPSASKGHSPHQPPPETQKGSCREAVFSEKDSPHENNFEGIIGRSAAIRALRKEVRVVAPTDATILVLGETGTGKELIARAIHNLSPRRDRPFIKVNCAAIPSGLIESELFGHERGAFTGSIGRRTGRFEMADGGTLFLDEIGDVPPELQPKLLRVLQEQEFERVGGSVTMRTDARIVAATSRNLQQMVSAREFRADLYYRLNVFPIYVAALRERSEDIPLLVRHFVELHAKRMVKSIKEIPEESMEMLSRYRWPGNVRELQNIVERSVILSHGEVLRLRSEDLQISSQKNEVVITDKANDRATLKDVERGHIMQALTATTWVLAGPNGAAARLGLPRTTLIAKMQKLGIARPLASTRVQ
jgi:formate hydrogenlyase transcriptional activator